MTIIGRHKVITIIIVLTRAPHAGANAGLLLHLENSRSKKGHNFVKKIGGLPSLLVWVPLLIVNNYSEFQVNIFSNNRDIRKCQSFAQTTFLTSGGETVLLDGWMDDLQFYILFNSISGTSGKWADNNERLCAMEPHLWLRRFLLHVGLQLGTTRLVGQRLTH